MGLFPLLGNSGDPVSRIAVIYRRADSLFLLSDNTRFSDSLSLEGFEKVISALQHVPAGPGKDTLLFQSWLKKGILLDSRYDYSAAKSSYCQALRFHHADDSLTFVLYVYAGTSYYNLNDFDSARYFLRDAESRSDRYADPADVVRLYNTLGVLYYDNGNYAQGKNYFNRALGIVRGRSPFDTAAAVSLQTNIATCFYHLGEFTESLGMYRQILALHQADDPVWLNMGMAYESLDRYREALNCFKKVAVKNVPGVLNEMGHVFWQLDRPDSATRYLDKLDVLVSGKPDALVPRINELDLGTNDLYRADLLAGQGDYTGAVQYLQKAIIIYAPHFDNSDIFSNPASFAGSFASYRLFDAVFKKAVLLQQLYRTQPQEKWLVAAFDAYRASLAILRYIERSYDTDDAKLFLKKRTSAVYEGALSVCLELYRMHPEKDYLEQAFLISEKSKASVIAANLRERSVSAVDEDSLQVREEGIKYNIARLDVKLGQGGDAKEISRTAQEKAGYEIQLAQLQKKLEQDGNYYRVKYEDSVPGIAELQANLGKDQALISCHLGTDALHVFVLTRSAFSYVRIDSLALLRRAVADWLAMLKTVESGRKFRGGDLGDLLSRVLVSPIQALVPDKDEWIVVPDGFLYFLPFEAIPSATDPSHQPLLYTTTISYQFAARLILAPGSPSKKETHPGQILAFAPFTGTGFLSTGAYRFPPLPGSKEEVSGLPGQQFTGKQATKTLFLKDLNQYPILHLATHAVSSVTSAAGSFIAFYPQKDTPIDDCLFLEELYGLNMDRTRLVVISACETGQGELVSNEGVISLARAFAYAGCESSISSLWKADDEATSFILQRFYIYLEKGYKKSTALRRAKLDYLASGTINKSPAYWSHLVLIGDTSPLYHRAYPWWWLTIPLLGLLYPGVRNVRRFQRRKKSR
ncbi:MAG TPA: CHAT domain-containing tetratricopeptide repeat protein [Puia sp.]|nr:CHAT domain-containing tetratricopeptide repeat protein [Puia sp.]